MVGNSAEEGSTVEKMDKEHWNTQTPSFYIDSLICVLLVRRSSDLEENPLGLFHYYGVHFSSFFKCKISNHFKENSNVEVVLFSYHTSMPLARLVLILRRKKKVALNSNRSSALQEGRWHLLEEKSLFRDSFGPLLLLPSTNVSHFLSLGDVDREVISHTYLVLLESGLCIPWNNSPLEKNSTSESQTEFGSHWSVGNEVTTGPSDETNWYLN